MKTLIPIKIDNKLAYWDIEKPLLTKGCSNLKIYKSEKYQDGIYSTMILHLSPAKISGYNLCPKASEGCKAICLNMAGQGGMITNNERFANMIHIARSGRTTLLKNDKSLFFMKLKNEIDGFLIKCKIKNSKPCIRLNGTSDLNWTKILDPESNKNLMELFPMIQFYDYTKDINQLKNLPKNYHLTFSRSENNQKDVEKALNMGFNVAVVFDKKKGLPNTFMGHPVFNADQTDLRFLDNKLSGYNKPIIAGLIEKGYLSKYDTTGFVVRNY